MPERNLSTGANRVVRGCRIEHVCGNPELGPSRIKCALLGMKVLKVGVYGYLGTKFDEPED
jgi:hypothetical protein